MKDVQDTWCLPSWHPAALAFTLHRSKVTACAPDAAGFVPCAPETLRATAQSQMQRLGLMSRVSLDTYSLARNIQSEWGSGPVEGKAAIAECAVNQARRAKKSVTELLLVNSTGRSLYGRQAQGRFASTSQDPTAADVLLADFVLRGKTRNFSRGGTKYLDPNSMSSEARLFEVLADWMQRNVWVGYLPNVPLRRLIVLRNTKVGSREAQTNREALASLKARKEMPIPSAICRSPVAFNVAMPAAAALAAAGVLLLLHASPQARQIPSL